MSEETLLVAEVILLAMKVQKETDHAVFISFSGHVDLLGIHIRKSKEDYTVEIASSDFYINRGEDSIKRLQDVKETLLGFLEDGRVDTSKLDYRVREVYDYVF